MTDLVIARIGAASEAESPPSQTPRYRDDAIAAVAEPGGGVPGAETRSTSGDLREHPDAGWRRPSGGTG